MNPRAPQVPLCKNCAHCNVDFVPIQSYRVGSFCFLNARQESDPVNGTKRWRGAVGCYEMRGYGLATMNGREICGPTGKHFRQKNGLLPGIFRRLVGLFSRGHE